MVKYGLLVGVLGAYVSVSSASSCIQQYDPVCGSDGKTYSNNCFLALQMAKNPHLQLKYRGSCEEHDRQIRSTVCSTERKNVCGSDGITYRHPCFLNKASNATNKIEILHHGPCNNKSIEIIRNQSHEEIAKNFTKEPKSEHIQSLLKTIVPVLPEIKNINMSKDLEAKPLESNITTTVAPRENPTIQLSCPCGLELEEICGNDGVTYDNPCLLNCAAKFNNTLDVLFEGRCNGSELVFAERQPRSTRINNDYNVNNIINGSDEEENELLCPCERNYLPMCGTDGRTYDNPCLLKCAAKRNNSIKVKFVGRCDEENAFAPNKPQLGITADGIPIIEDLLDRELTHEVARRLKRDTKIAKRAKNIENDLSQKLLCPCARNLLEVCGTDGVTYNNECLLKCAQRKNKNLRIKFVGRCERKHMFRRDINPRLDIYEKKNLPNNKYEILKSCVCPYIYHRVCGTDGVTYANLCYLKCARNSDNSIQIQHEGPCDTKEGYTKKISKRHANIVTFRY